MIEIGNVLVSDELVEEAFVCDLLKCKGGCCVDGDAGAPLEDAEKNEVLKALPKTLPLLPQKHVEVINKMGAFVWDDEYGWVTPTVDGGICTYGIIDEAGIVKCAFEELYNQKQITWKKPISCHLFPAITKTGKTGNYILVNYEPRKDLCKPACQLGKRLQVPVYEFLKEPLIRKFGKKFFNALQAAARFKQKHS